ncbi:MAG: PEGA domain-containing protein [Polyangiales bacterium]
MPTTLRDAVDVTLTRPHARPSILGARLGGVARRSTLAAFVVALSASTADAQVPPRVRFDRGVALSAEGDWRSALQEFRAAFDQTQNPEVLFNIASAHEHLDQYVEAVEALERYQRLAPPRAVARHREAVVVAMERLVNRVGTLRVVNQTTSARCVVDAHPYENDALRAGVRVSMGRRVVRCEAPGFDARERSVEVAPNAVSEVSVELQHTRASITVTTDRAGAEVRVDGRPVARTPLAQPVEVDEGSHRVEVSLPGYDTVTQSVDARGDGARVEATLRWSDPVPPDLAARLVVRTNVSNALATLDGRAIPVAGTRALPPGAHRLRVERDDYLAVEREVTLAIGARSVEDVALSPTPSFRDAYLDRAHRQRRLWQTIGGSGLVLTVVGAIVLGVALPRTLDADSRAAVADAQYLACQSQGGCGAATMTRLSAERDNAETERAASLPTTVTGGVLTGVGVAGILVGVILRADAEPVDRFDRPPTFRVGLGPSNASLEVAF